MKEQKEELSDNNIKNEPSVETTEENVQENSVAPVKKVRN